MNKFKQGQSLIEYALILALVALAFGVAVATTGPAIGNVFSNTVYNLLGESPEPRDSDSVADFWLTVTWVKENPLQEQRLPTRTAAPPSATPTEGPPPLPTDILPTNTPIPSPTPAPSPTPGDFAHDPPFWDRAEEPVYWRVAAEAFIGTDDWYGEYYVGTKLDSDGTAPTYQGWNRDMFGSAAAGKLDFPNTDYAFWMNDNLGPIMNWPNRGPGGDPPYDKFSVRWTKNIYIPGEEGDPGVPVTFVVEHDDGVRLWLLEKKGDAATCSEVRDGTSDTVKTGVDTPDYDLRHRAFGDGSAFATDCLLLNNWESGQDSGVVTRTIPPGNWVLQADLQENTGDAYIQLDHFVAPNPDDTTVDAAGNPRADPATCGWSTRAVSEDANSLYDEWTSYDSKYERFPLGQRCYLELRGFVRGGGLTNPELTYWDLWDYNSAGVDTWLEVAEYIPVADTEWNLDRDVMEWIKIPVDHAGSMNYNWTGHTINLNSLPVGAEFVTGPNAGSLVDPTYTLAGKDITVRFVMQNRSDSSSRRSWYVDDVKLHEGVPEKTWDLDGDEFSPGATSFWNLNDPDANNGHADFITSGHWQLTSNKAMNDGGLGWDVQQPDEWGNMEYADHSEMDSKIRDEGYPSEKMRIHTVEFKGTIDLTLPLEDSDGDTGNPMLSFFEAYKVGDYTGLEVQFLDPSDSTWKPIPDPEDPVGNPPVGRIVDIANVELDGSYTSAGYETLHPVDIDLYGLTQAPYNLATVRLRFALMVAGDNDNDDGGWWIDNIKLHRKDRATFNDYPLVDGAEDGKVKWLGGWSIVNEEFWDGNHSYTDSPGGAEYERDTTNAMRLLLPIDMNNDTPDNLASERGGNTAGAAINPVLRFYHKRWIDNGDAFNVSWRRASETEDEWKPVWTFQYNMTPDGNNNSNRYSWQSAWEYVEIDLAAINYEIDAGSKTDDDILIRFSIYANNSSNDDGVYLDAIRVEERYPYVSTDAEGEPTSFEADGVTPQFRQRVHRLWPDESREVDDDGNEETGDGMYFSANVDEPDWYDRWIPGGRWTAINYEARAGLQSWHESPDQPAAPVHHGGGWDDDIERTDRDAYQVLQLSYVVDLRGTQQGDKPTMYFWTRFALGNNERISVEVSTELEGTPGEIDAEMLDSCPGDRLQCWGQDYGWGSWHEHKLLWTGSGENEYFDGDEPYRMIDYWEDNYGWTRHIVDLSPFAGDASGPGQRIRVRFVYDSLDNTNYWNARDGWYIDHVTFESRRDSVIRRISDQQFFDPARNMSNWTGEGLWGLSPEIFRGTGGGPAVLGSWDEYVFDCNDCDRLIGSGNNNDKFKGGASLLLDNVNPATGIASASGNGRTVDEEAIGWTGSPRTVLDISYDFGTGDMQPGRYDISNEIAARWLLETPEIGPFSGVQANDYTFITVSDNGVRMKYEEVDAAGNIIDTEPTVPGNQTSINSDDSKEWNIIYNWTDHARTVDMGVARLDEGKYYRFTLDWYEKDKSGVIILTTGGTSFSFTDSPKSGVGEDDIGSIAYSHTALILNGTLDLSDTFLPELSYYTMYETEEKVYVEVSTNGGFSWTRNWMGRDIYAEGVNCNDDIDYGDMDTWDCDLDPIIMGFNGEDPEYFKVEDYDSSKYGDENSNNTFGDWMYKRHSLRQFVGDTIMIRFLMSNMTDDRQKGNADNDYMTSWWIVDIRVADATCSLPEQAYCEDY